MSTSSLIGLSTEKQKQYFSPGWTSFADFYSSQNWATIYCGEENPATVVVNGRIRKDKPDMAKAKQNILSFAGELVKHESVIYLEMGVRAGLSMMHMSKCLQRDHHELHGFDTFTGLPDGWLPAWGGNAAGRFREPGEMAVPAMPVIEDKRVILHKGLFQDTLPCVFPRLPLFTHRFINIDSDTYSGALYTLTQLHGFIKKGDIIYFDEFHDELNEYAAFNDYVRSYYTRNRFALIARAYDAYCFNVIQ